MASIVSHPAVPLGLALAFGYDVVSPRLTAAGVVCSCLPDIDALGFWIGIPYAHLLGHRGITHSLAFSMVVAGAGSLFARQLDANPWVVFFVLLACTASHGVLDAMTNGGLGVAFFSPFSNRRYFLPWRVLEVSPIGVSGFFSSRGLRVLASELQYVWGPCLSFGFLGLVLRKLTGSS